MPDYLIKNRHRKHPLTFSEQRDKNIYHFFVIFIGMNSFKWLDHLSSFGMDAVLLAIGILFLTQKVTGWTILYLLIVVLCFFLPFQNLLSIHSGAKPASRTDFLLAFFNITFGIIILIWPDQFMKFMHVFYGWWMLGHAILMLINFYVYLVDQLPNAIGQLFSGIVSLIIGFFMITGQNISIKTEILSIIAGIYFILYGLMGFVMHLLYLLKKQNPKFRSLSLSSPILLSAFLPIRFYISIKNLKLNEQLQENSVDNENDLHVYIYLKGKGPEMFGHTDIGYKGTIWSYGNHDPAARHLLGTYGDGVLIRANEKLFLKESIGTDGKTIVGYGIHLTDAQKAVLEKRLEALMARAVPWKCAAQIAMEKGEDASSCKDYASRVYKETHCDMFKFQSGKFRTYFIASTNCVMIADELIRNRDLNLIDLNGLITPGAYLSFLNTEYLKKNTPVYSRIFYEKGINEPVIDPVPEH